MKMIKVSIRVILTCLLLACLHFGAWLAVTRYFNFNYFFGSLVLWQICGGIGISICYHRQLTHRAFATNNFVKFFHLLVAGLAGQQGPISWARVHRAHHKHSDSELDPHSPLY